MPTISYPVGAHIPNMSRYKCMKEFLRPVQIFRDLAGNMTQGSSPGITTCCLPKNHKGPHTNVRGEVADKNAIESVDEFHRLEMEKVKKELEQMKKIQAELLEKLQEPVSSAEEKKGKK